MAQINRTPSQHLFIASFLSCLLLLPGTGAAQSNEASTETSLTPYPSSPVIEAEPLERAALEGITKLITLPPQDKDRSKIKETLCPPRVSKSESPALSAALAVTESDMTVEIQFGKTGTGRETEAKNFSMFLDFSERELLIRPSLPRYASDGQGLLVPYPNNQARPLWVEGKGGSDMLFIVPEVGACAVQAVALCPRTYVPRTTLATTGYAPSGARYLVSAKADGLFAVGSGETGRIQASLGGAGGVQLPSTWFHEERSTTPSATVKFFTPREAKDTPPPFTPIEVPARGAIEARLDFGKESSLRNVRTRTTVEITRFQLEAGTKAKVRGVDLNVEPGPCFLVTKRKDVLG